MTNITNRSERKIAIYYPNRMDINKESSVATSHLIDVFFAGDFPDIKKELLNTKVTGTIQLDDIQAIFNDIVVWVFEHESYYSKNDGITQLVSQMLSVLRNTSLELLHKDILAPDVTFVFGGKTLDTSDDAAAVGAYVMLSNNVDFDYDSDIRSLAEGYDSVDDFKITNGNTSIYGNKDGLNIKADKITLDGVSSEVQGAPMTVEEYDMVHHPKHYQLPSGKETKEVLYDLLGSEGYQFWCVGNTVKYISRYKDKENPIQDLEKAQQNIQMIIDVLKKEDQKWI